MNWKFLTVLVFLVSSCSDAIEPESNVERLEKALVFGSRNVEQIRGTMSRASSEPEGSDRRAYEYQAAQLARATATITPNRRKARANCVVEPGLGSATLTSDSRMTTAYHVVEGAIEDYSAYFEASPILGKFANQYVARNANTLGLIPEDGKLSVYPENWEETIEHRSDAIEESPFLANRLFVLGLDDWAHPIQGKDARKYLRRGFRFIIDEIQPGHDGYVANTPGGQGFVYDSFENYEGRDIAVLRMTRNAHINNLVSTLKTGDFDVIKPAVFFGKVQMVDSVEHPIKDVNFLNHTAPWPFRIPKTEPQLVPLTSFYAGYANLWQGRTLLKDFCRGPKPVDFKSRGLFQTSFDSVAGSSGGMVLTPDSFKRESEYAAPLVGMGILSGPSAIDPKPHVKWAKPIGFNEPNSSYAVNITGTSIKDLKIFERDTVPIPTDDPSKPTPIIEGEKPECETFSEEKTNQDGTKLCEKYKTSDPRPPKSALNPPKGIKVLEGADAEKIGEGVGRRFACYSHKEGAPPNIMVGILGGLALNGINVSESPETIIENGGGIGSFMGICTPYSSVPYTDNWRFLSIKGAQMPRELDTLGGPYGWDLFDRYQSRVYEERSVKGEVYVRPPSTRMCPPHYVLRGVSLSIHDAKDQHYSGVNELICVKPQSSTKLTQAADEIRVTLKGEESHYTLGGKPFGLSQYIGIPGTCGDRCVDFQCDDPGDAIYGLETSHDNKGRLTDLKVRCIKSP